MQGVMIAHFAKEKLATIAAARSARAERVAHASRTAATKLECIDTLARRCFESASEEPRSFLFRLGEPMPAHVSRALEYEVRGWGRLYECLQDFRQADPSARDIATYTHHVQAFLAIQQDLLRAEEEMLGSCLVRHYESLADELRDRGLRVPL